MIVIDNFFPHAPAETRKIVKNAGVVEPISATTFSLYPNKFEPTPFCRYCSSKRESCATCRINKAYILRKKGI